MVFKITGRVTEKESGLGVQGLMIRAYDKDLLYDDLLGTATTDKDGRFEMIYTEKDFRELFESSPDIYLSVYAPPFRFLVDTTEAVRWAASEEEHFDLDIDRETLGDASPGRPQDRVAGGISLPADAITITKRAGFDVPKLPDFTTGGVPGAPALPEQIRYVVLPLGGDVLSLKVTPGNPVHLPGEMRPLPAQRPILNPDTDPDQFRDGFSPPTTYFEFTPPDPRYFERIYPETLVELDSVQEIGLVQIAVLRVRPVQFVPQDKTFVFYPNLRYEITFDQTKAAKLAEERDRLGPTAGELELEMLNLFAQQDLVEIASNLYLPEIILLEGVPHVIITDNYEWPESVARGDGTTRPPNLSERGDPSPGDPVAELERLAEWRTSRGVRSRVVTVSDIVDGCFGDLTEDGFARDLQEVLRNFCKFARKEWGTLYVLLAGDVDVIPMRQLVGCGHGSERGCSRQSENPPPTAKCYLVSGQDIMKLHPSFEPDCATPLSTYHGGVRIPFDREAGPDRLGWYYTSEDDFNDQDSDFTCLPAGQTSEFIIVEGPESIIDDDYYWVTGPYLVPSDFYYASIKGSSYSTPGKHDFDSNDNGLYGQYHQDEDDKTVTLDGVNFQTRFFQVGRVQVASGDQARAFVDKVITYERLETPDGQEGVNLAHLQKVLYAAARWTYEKHWPQSDTSKPPEEGRFTHEAGTTITKIHTSIELALSEGIPSHHLIARSALSGRFSFSDVFVPYNEEADSDTLGWAFMEDDTYSTLSDSPTPYIKVQGPEADIAPGKYFFFDPAVLEPCAVAKETVRQLITSYCPSFTAVERHYEDYLDLTAPPPLVPLEADTIRAALDDGVHFASLSGHGSSNYCCEIDILDRPDFTNSRRYFIMYADSCSTASPYVDSLAKVTTLAPDGGAVGYVGYTRHAAPGTDYEWFFWKYLMLSGRLGDGLRRTANLGHGYAWHTYVQNLFGDPRMAVWTGVPRLQEVTHNPWGDIVTVTVSELGTPLAHHRVTLMGEWTHPPTRPYIFMTKKTNSLGRASFKLPTSGSITVSQLRVTVTGPNFKPYIGTITLPG